MMMDPTMQLQPRMPPNVTEEDALPDAPVACTTRMHASALPRVCGTVRKGNSKMAFTDLGCSND